MKTISKWAQTHRIQAIFSVVILQTLLVISYFFAGVYLFAYDIVFPPEAYYVGAGIFLIAFVIYPFKNAEKGWYKYSYNKIKSIQGLILLSTIILVCNVGNQLARSAMMTSTDYNFEARPVVLDSKEAVKNRQKKSRKERRLERRKLKKQFRAMVKSIRKGVKLKGGDIAGIVLLSLLFTVLFGYLVLALYCNLACSGHTSLALIVLMTGAFFWGLGIVGIIRWISKKRLQKENYYEKD